MFISKLRATGPYGKKKKYGTLGPALSFLYTKNMKYVLKRITVSRSVDKGGGMNDGSKDASPTNNVAQRVSGGFVLQCFISFIIATVMFY